MYCLKYLTLEHLWKRKLRVIVDYSRFIAIQTLNSKGALMSNVSNSYKVIQIHNNTK